MLKRTLTAAVSAAALAAATSAGAGSLYNPQEWTLYDVEEVHKTTYSGESFPQSLAREYKKFATFEAYDMYDWIDAEHFAEKAKAAASGADVQPEAVGDWNIPEKHVSELTDARARLMGALARGARTKAPGEAAVAQAKFDCWLEQQEENHQWNHIAECRDAFFTALDTLDEKMAPKSAMETKAPTETEPAAGPKTVTTEVEARTAVFFAFDSAALSDEARKTIGDLVNSIDDKNAVELRVAGHADRAGPSDYNMKLSERRARTVVNLLQDRGLRAVRLKDLDVVAKGESEPIVDTGDGVAERSNRRVEITVHALEQVQVDGTGPTGQKADAER